MSRKFNQNAYDKFDNKCKVAAIDYLQKKGFYPISDLETEYYKKYDLEMVNAQGMTIKIENEFRGKFHEIKETFKSFHIPIRKKYTEADFYFIWGPEYDEIGIITKKVFIKYRDDVKSLVCQKDKPHEWIEDFIDVPVNEIIFRKIEHNDTNTNQQGQRNVNDSTGHTS